MDQAVNITHRVGQRLESKNRHVIVMFTQGRAKEEVWRRSKGSPVYKNKGIRFAKVLLREDWEESRLLRLQIEQARQAGKTAFFRGSHGIIEGRKITLM